MSDDIERTLGRIETRVSTLNERVVIVQNEVSALKRVIESDLVAHRERITSLEAFRRWSIGMLTGALLSVFAAWMAGHAWS
jgi:hypothetical protein